MNTHTKGPWKFGRAAYSVNQQEFISDNPDYRMVRAGIGYYDPKETESGFDLVGIMSEKDNALIAAAPEMYELLKEMLQYPIERLDMQRIESLLNRIDLC